ncbi:MAG: sigma-54-dependent Fis family transcriptional regulator [Verrucomicrobia bacterium]|jgi:DNA-binding NtrC family response regulator|nr:sigma-54-dependent Fis family transcriptional regulator [Verrucomicrobiota bacterium]
MIVAICEGKSSGRITRHIESLGHRHQACDQDSISELSHHSSGLVYVFPLAVTQSPIWPSLRVRLAHTNRLYIVVGEDAPTDQIVTVVRDGAYDYLDQKDPDNRWNSALDKAVESQGLWIQLYGGAPIETEDMLIGRSPGMMHLKEAITRLGPTDATVLILGDSGVGKERVAEALHKASGKGPFVPINCAAIPKELIESELFGAVKGAYTGALKDRSGLVEQARGGTLFLDEIGEFDISLQPKLLRFLETRMARKVGGQSEYKADLRVISATNRNLQEDIDSNAFRADLYYRLSEITLRVPPLKLRLEDIPLFAISFMQKAGERFGKMFDQIEPELVKRFQSYDWPGNVRELKSQIDRMVILYDGPILREAWWDSPQQSRAAIPPAQQAYDPHSNAAPAQASYTGMPIRIPSQKERMERARELLASDDQNLSWVSAQLGIHPTTLYRWRKQGKV